MESINFEDYRQPWETGPHWELKKEFLEKYQDLFPVDRLLCLAQAYSNIELLQCSYPAPVMRQIHELKKPLKGYKHFRKNEDLPNQNTGKRSCGDNVSKKKMKLIKFCSSSDSMPKSSEETCMLEKKNITSFNISNTSNFSDISNTSNISDIINTSNGSDISNASYVSGILNTSNASDIANNCSFPVNLKDVNDSLISNNKLRDSLSSGTVENISHSKPKEMLSVYYSSIARTSDFKTIEKLASQIQTLSIGKADQALTAIEYAAVTLNMANEIRFVLKKLNGKSSVDALGNCYCDFYIGSTLISTGCGPSENNAKRKTANLALKVLKNVQHLPTKSLEEILIQSSSEFDFKEQKDSDNNLLKKFATLIKTNMQKDNNALSMLYNIGQTMKISNSLLFNISEDFSTPPHDRLFVCSFSLKNILISQGKGNSKKKAKNDAAEFGIKKMLDLLELENRKIPDSPSKERINEIDHKLNNSSIVKEPENSFSELIERKSNTQNFNKTLFDNSIKRQLVLFDKSFLDPSQDRPRSILAYSAQQCRKNSLAYEIEDNGDGTSRATVLIDDEIIGTGVGISREKAKEEAALSALQNLRKQVYTVKVKLNEGEGCMISHNDVVNWKSAKTSESVSEDNIGCKMLKMMGWSGGGIGKSEGITEPVTVKDNSFGRGLGYSGSSAGEVDEMSRQPFKQKIQAILKDFSSSNSIDELIFSTEFSKAERKEIHKIALQFNLRNQSYGKDNNRRLSVRRKITVPELLNYLLKVGGSTDKYELIDLSI